MEVKKQDQGIKVIEEEQGMGGMGEEQEKETQQQKVEKGFSSVHYDVTGGIHQHDPFQLMDSTWYGGVFVEPPHPSLTANLLDNYQEDENNSKNIGYIQDPNVHNNTIVFCSEGDLYLTTFTTTNMPAMRLTSTVGNVLEPKLNPKYPYLVAFTATYTGNREAYIMDLRFNHRSTPSMRVTYMDSKAGVIGIDGWEDDGRTLVVKSYNMEVALQDVRLYKIGILDATQDVDGSAKSAPSSQSSITVSSIYPIPLSQAIGSILDKSTGCRYFTRYDQSSNTIRYLGGTAPQLWVYCEGEELALPITGENYNGTSKSPGLYNVGDDQFLFFLSDRANASGGREDDDKTGEWIPSTMNLWSMILPKKQDLYSDALSQGTALSRPFQIISVSCEFNGMSLQEYAIDEVTGNVVLRIGADLFQMSKEDIMEKIMASSPSRRMDENENVQEKTNSSKKKIKALSIAIYSDFNNLHERVRPLNNPNDVSSIDIFSTSYGTVSTLMTARGQLFVNPVIVDKGTLKTYDGGGMNMPQRRYRLAPGSTTGGMIRIIGAWHVPTPLRADEMSRVALVLGTDPKTPTAEMAFYLLEASADTIVEFADITDLPKPILGGHVNGGSVKDGGLGSVNVESVSVSPCGRRVGWTDTDGRTLVMSLTNIENLNDDDTVETLVLPDQNENKEPLKNVDGLSFSPAGRYLAIEHTARNQFQVISIVDLGEPSTVERLTVDRIVQATPDRFNSFSPFWGRLPIDFKLETLQGQSRATTIFFLTDRDVILTGRESPWGARAPLPNFAKSFLVYALPLVSKEDELYTNPMGGVFGGNFVGGGAAELSNGHMDAWQASMSALELLNALNDEEVNATDSNNILPKTENNTTEKVLQKDMEISFDDKLNNMEFARRAFLLSEIPAANYIYLHQFQDNPSFLMVEVNDAGADMVLYLMNDFPNESIEKIPITLPNLIIQSLGLSTNREFLHFTYSGVTKVVANTFGSFSSLFISDVEFKKNIVDTMEWAVHIWPKLEYQQLYSDAWRMLRDYYYDPTMGEIDWPEIHARYLTLVARCGRREELDDVLRQMSSELSALHVFVYGGEYNDPSHGDKLLKQLNAVSSLGAYLQRSDEWGGYEVKEIARIDPDFNPIDGEAIYSPLESKTLEKVGQRGLLEGDVIVTVNGESVRNVPDIHMLLRGMAGRSVRLEVLRINSKSSFSNFNRRKLQNETETTDRTPEPVIVVPITQAAAANVRYAAWEWKTRESAKEMAKSAGFSVGYVHLRTMSGAEGEDAFVRGLYPDYDKEGLIIDVRHNTGGNIDSWLLNTLQRKAWMYFQSRAFNVTNGGLGWNEQFAFRGHVVVLVDEKTSSDAEGFSRGFSELGLGLIIGTRTWGGGIWLSSDNILVDGGIATAPEIGVYNAKFGWGLGIEQMGVTPDIVVDNNPKESYEGKDRQLERAIETLKALLEADPVLLPENPGPHRDMSLHKKIESCDEEKNN